MGMITDMTITGVEPTDLTSTYIETADVSVPNVGESKVGESNVGEPNVGEPNVGDPNVGDPKDFGSLGLEFVDEDISSEVIQPFGSPVWFGPAEQPMRGWIHKPLTGNILNSRRIVIVPGFGYEELTSGWGLRIVAEELALAGHTVLRYDHPGTGDSSGDNPSVRSWLEGIHHAVSALNFPDVTLIGIRLGGTLALAAAAEPSNVLVEQSRSAVPEWVPFGNGSITQIIAVSPVVTGRRMVRELTMLAAAKKAVSSEPTADYELGPLQPSWAAPITSASPPSQPSTESGPLVVGGFSYPDELRKGLSSLDLLGLSTSPAPRVEIVHASERSTDKNLASHLRSLGTAVYESRVEGIAKWLDTSSELASAPQALIDLLKGQLYGESMVDAEELTGRGDTRRCFSQGATFRVNGETLRERVFRVGEPSLSAVTTEPIKTPATSTVAVLLLNSGVERSVGPGRAWVSWSRSLASAGHNVLRLDLSGVGNSGTWPGKPAFHTYGSETFEDVAHGIALLRAMGHQKIVVVGLCASAFSALGTTVDPSVVAIVSLSPQFYRCGTPGSMAEAEDTNFNRHRISQLDQKLNLRRKGAAVEELVGKRHLCITWIDSWIAQGTQVHLVFGPDDRGLRFLQWRTPRSLKRLAKTGKFALQVHPTLDHALHEVPARDEVFRDLCKLLKSL